MNRNRGLGSASTIVAAMLLAMLVPAGYAWAEQGKAAVNTAPASRAKASGKIMATVNGVPIYESELLAGMPDDAFEQQLESMKKSKLSRFIGYVVQAQFLKERKIRIPDDELDKEIKKFEQLVTTVGLACCSGGYESLEQFMKLHAYTMPEVRREVGLTAGMKLYEKRLADEQTTPAALATAAKMRRAQIESDYVLGYAISFYYVRDRSIPEHENTETKKEKLANEALARLKKGDSFEQVARELSEDETSSSRGGALGCIRVDRMGSEVEKNFRTLPFGKHSGIVKTDAGCFIVMRKKLTEQDVLSVLKDLAMNSAKARAKQEYSNALERAKKIYY